MAQKNMRIMCDDFTLATGISTNFEKPTFVPLNLEPNQDDAMAADLGTNIAASPHKYLSLPLSPHKLPATSFQLDIDHCDIYLAGWCTLLLSRDGRINLLSIVLGGLPTYFMLGSHFQKRSQGDRKM